MNITRTSPKGVGMSAQVEEFWEYLRTGLEAQGSKVGNKDAAATNNRALFYRLCRDYFQDNK